MFSASVSCFSQKYVQMSALDDKDVPSAEQWRDAVTFMTSALSRQIKQAEADLQQLVGPTSYYDRWLLWKHQSASQVCRQLQLYVHVQITLYVQYMYMYMYMYVQYTLYVQYMYMYVHVQLCTSNLALFLCRTCMEMRYHSICTMYIHMYMFLLNFQQ